MASAIIQTIKARSSKYLDTGMDSLGRVHGIRTCFWNLSVDSFTFFLDSVDSTWNKLGDYPGHSNQAKVQSKDSSPTQNWREAVGMKAIETPWHPLHPQPEVRHVDRRYARNVGGPFN